jgi:hypothetical protein
MNLKGWCFLVGICFANAGCREAAKAAPRPLAHDVSLNRDTVDRQKSVCPRPFIKSGVPIRGLVTAADSSSFSLTEISPRGRSSRQFIFAFYGCLPIESTSGDSLPLSSLVPGRVVLVWPGPAMRPTQPVQASAEGVQIQK